MWFPVAILIGVATSDPRPGLTGVHLAVLVALAAGVAAIYLLFWCRDHAVRWVPAPAFAAVVVSVSMFGLSPNSPAIAYAYAAIWIAIWVLPLWQAVAMAVTGACGVGLLAWFGAVHDDAALGLAIGFLAVTAASYAIRERRIARVQAENARTAQAGEAALAERARIAREIHDILAHSLSAQIVHLEGARLLLKRGDDPGAALDRVERAQRLARTGLEETKRALSALRDDAPPVGEVLRGLAEDFREVSGDACELTVTGEERHLPAGTSLAVVRTAQEALTNARRHAPGADVTVGLRYGPDGWCELAVTNPLTDDPEPSTPADGGGGYGLVGMRERAELLGGSLTAAAEDGEFRVLLRVPA